MPSNSNRGVVYLKPGSVEVQKIDFPTFRNPAGKTIDHGVILRVVTTNICGSDQHMGRGRTTAPAGMVLGHEITGEVIEKGRDVEYLQIGDLVSVPFNVACGRCRTCREGDTGVCLHVNSDRAGGAYGYVDMGGWIGGQADYVMVPYADFNLLKFPDKAQAMEKITDLTCLSDILPTGFHGAVTAKVGVGSTVYVAGAGPVGLAAAASARILGAAAVLIGDMNRERLAHAKSVGFSAGGPTNNQRPGRTRRRRPWGSRSRLRDRLRRLRSKGARNKRQSRRSARRGAEQPDGDHAGGRRDRHSRPVCDRRSRRQGAGSQTWQSQPAPRSWLGKVTRPPHRPDAGAEI